MSASQLPLVHRLGRSIACVVVAAAACVPALAHHGWAWAEEGNSEIAGTIVSTKLGNPHGEVTVDVSGVKWVVEVGQPWRNQRAGLKDELLSKGVQLKAVGHKHADPKQHVFKAERIVIDGKTYDLYPDRD
jgi:hypothetical protein